MLPDTALIGKVEKTGQHSCTIPLRVRRPGQTHLVLLAELEGSKAVNWEAARNTAFFDHLRVTGDAANAVVLLSPGALPREPDGKLGFASVCAEYRKTYGYVREELNAWLVNHICEILFLAPSGFDTHVEWARYGVDSALALELVGDLEEHLQVRLPQSFADCRSVADILDTVSPYLINGDRAVNWWRAKDVRVGQP